uniref:Uncharacterized protein n=1 Tax=Pithovirus LCDPAC02 TaxID=2506601 RepID=A0A481YRA3_9VIRU|nr:MAG: hypothetical protein LCDPAC02_01850 [Pithovirus LCDPAC02]
MVDILNVYNLVINMVNDFLSSDIKIDKELTNLFKFLKTTNIESIIKEVRIISKKEFFPGSHTKTFEVSVNYFEKVYKLRFYPTRPNINNRCKLVCLVRNYDRSDYKGYRICSQYYSQSLYLYFYILSAVGNWDIKLNISEGIVNSNNKMLKIYDEYNPIIDEDIYFLLGNIDILNILSIGCIDF